MYVRGLALFLVVCAGVLYSLHDSQWKYSVFLSPLSDTLFVCFIWVLRHFQQSFSHIVTVSGCGRELIAHF